MGRLNTATPEAQSGREPIAIVGIGCRLPGGADSPSQLWKLLRAGVDAIGPMPPERFPSQVFDDSTPSGRGKIAIRQGGFLDRIDGFDAQFFGVSPREAKAMDPQQRLLLETAWEALEDAGLVRERLAGSATGVYIGMWTNEYEDTMFAASDDIDLYMTTGGGRYAAAGRLSYAFDLQGPSLTVDTACSSSLVAVHLACQGLWAGETEQALVGAVNLILQPSISIGYSRSRMLSPDGRCKFGDARANGYVRSEGCAVVALKPLSRALADGNQVYALIRGTAVNNDGHSSGLLVAPSGHGQFSMLREVYRQAGIVPGEVDFVEAHGTGTAVGDPVELRALGEVLAEGRAPGRPCIVGSIKTNIGHTEAAAGMAGLIKAALCLKHGAIPASLHFETPNPGIPWDELPLTVQRSFGPWPEGDGPRYAGVNSFGVTGTNAHVVLQEAPKQQAAAPAGHGPLVLAISAHTPSARAELARRYREALAQTDAASAHEICYSAATGRSHHEQRLAVVAADGAGLDAGLAAFLGGEAHPGVSAGQAAPEAPRIAFVFPGQGSQWPGMARELLTQEPAFRAALERCDAAIRAETGWSPLEQLVAGEDESRLGEIDVIQPTLFAIQVALAAVWQSWGITPSAVVGHSMGEVAAAHVAGALSLEDAVAVICRRSRLLRRVRGRGAMAVVELPLEEARAAVAGYEDRIAIAVSNGPRSTVLSGDPDALATMLARLEQRDVFCRMVKVDVASHSPQMDPLLDELRDALAGLSPRAAKLAMYSTVDGAIAGGGELDAGYWARNLRRPVLFAAAARQLSDDGHTVFIEISPHPILLPAIEQVLHDAGRDGLALPSLRRAEPELATILGGLAALYTAGATVRWGALYPDAGRHIALPTYPWQHERFWYEPAHGAATPARQGGHVLLGHALRPAADPGSICWETSLDSRRLPFLADHRVQSSAILPATGFFELALAAAAEAGKRQFVLEHAALREALAVPEGAERAVQLVLDPHGPGALRFRIFAADGDGADWQLYADGQVREDALVAAPAHEAPSTVLARCREELSDDGHYAAMSDRALDYGPAFRTVQRCWLGDGEAIGRLARTAAEGPGAARITLLDGCLQLAVDALPASTAGQTFLPVSVERLQIFSLPESDVELWGHVVVTEREDGASTCDVFMLDGAGAVLAELRGLRLRQAGRGRAARLDGLLYELRWEQAPHPASAAPDEPGSWLILADRDAGRGLAARLAARGERCVLVERGVSRRLGRDTYALDPADDEAYAALLRSAMEPGDPPWRGIVYAWSAAITGEGPEAVAEAEELGCAAPIRLVRAIDAAGLAVPPRLWLLTRGAQAAGAASGTIVAPQAVAWGLGRVVATERPELRCTLIDLDPAGEEAGGQALVDELLAGAASPGDNQVALRGTQRYVARLARRAAVEQQRTPTTAAAEAYRLVAADPGALESLHPRSAARRSPGPGEIEVRVEAAGINFLDVLKALGIYPGSEPSPEVALGAECAGTVVAVGRGVDEFAPGDAVVAVTPSYAKTSMMSAYVTLPAAFAAQRPAGMTAPEASALPVAMMTAYYALHELGRMRHGERVLIHSATGGVGLAALQLCRRAGVEVFATAGSEEKRAYLRALGVEHVFDSRSLEFGAQVLAATGGRGVDLVLNSLTGEAIPASLAALAPRGRFLEIGKRDIYANSRIGLEPFKKNLSFFAIDLAGMTDQDPHFVAGLFREVIDLAAAGEIVALPTRELPITEAEETFRTMAQARHIGKLVLTVPAEPLAAETGLLRTDGTYLITGGLGGLGLAVARRLVERGARHLALLGRSAPSAEARVAVAELEASGARVLTVAADVARSDQLGAALEQIARHMPPLCGLVHAAGLLADATLAELNSEQLHAALAPKLAGAWNLHLLTAELPLDCFVLFSSASALLGLAGQANYAAGNAFLDALARQRRAAGLPALSINWGPWAEVGLAAAETNRGARLAGRGLGSLTPAEGLDAFELLLRADVAEAAVLRLDAARWAAHEPAAAPMLALLRGEPAQAAPARQGLREALEAVDPGRRRRGLLEDAVRAQLAQVLRTAPERIDRQRPLKSMGVDSLMALELRNRLEAETGLSLSATIAWNYPTVAIMADFLAGRMGIALEAPAATNVPAAAEASTSLPDRPEASTSLPDRPEALPDRPETDTLESSQDELEALLSDELDAVDRLLKAE